MLGRAAAPSASPSGFLPTPTRLSRLATGLHLPAGLPAGLHGPRFAGPQRLLRRGSASSGSSAGSERDSTTSAPQASCGAPFPRGHSGDTVRRSTSPPAPTFPPRSWPAPHRSGSPPPRSSASPARAASGARSRSTGTSRPTTPRSSSSSSGCTSRCRRPSTLPPAHTTIMEGLPPHSEPRCVARGAATQAHAPQLLRLLSSDRWTTRGAATSASTRPTGCSASLPSPRRTSSACRRARAPAPPPSPYPQPEPIPEPSPKAPAGEAEPRPSNRPSRAPTRAWRAD